MSPESLTIENELDIKKLFQRLWNGKLWIIGLATIFAGLALVYSYLVTPQWTSTAVITKPSITLLKDYYQQQKFLTSINGELISDQVITNSVYAEFIRQLSSYDSRRDFWLQSDYYLKQKNNNANDDTALLYKLIEDIRLSLNNTKSSLDGDSVYLVANTGLSSYKLLNEYLEFVAKRTVQMLNDDLSVMHAEQIRQLSVKMEQQKTMAEIERQREITRLTQTLMQLKSQMATSSNNDESQLAYNELNSNLEALKAEGPRLSDDYYQSQLLLAKLDKQPGTMSFQPYRLLKTPDEPIKRTSPRRLFLLVLWGFIGGFCGSTIALIRVRK